MARERKCLAIYKRSAEVVVVVELGGTYVPLGPTSSEKVQGTGTARWLCFWESPLHTLPRLDGKLVNTTGYMFQSKAA